MELGREDVIGDQKVCFVGVVGELTTIIRSVGLQVPHHIVLYRSTLATVSRALCRVGTIQYLDH
jgi:hypothetical protein